MAALPLLLTTIPFEKPAASPTQHKTDDGYHTPTSPPSQAKMICPPAPRKIKPRKRRRQLLEMHPEAISVSAEELDAVFRERTRPAAAVAPAPPPPPPPACSAESETSTTNGGSCKKKMKR